MHKLPLWDRREATYHNSEHYNKSTYFIHVWQSQSQCRTGDGVWIIKHILTVFSRLQWWKQQLEMLPYKEPSGSSKSVFQSRHLIWFILDSEIKHFLLWFIATEIKTDQICHVHHCPTGTVVVYSRPMKTEQDVMGEVKHCPCKYSWCMWNCFSNH